MTRTAGTPGKAASSRSRVVAAITERIAGASPPSSWATSSSAAGLTARSKTSQVFRRSTREGRVSPPTSAARAAARSASMSKNSIAQGRSSSGAAAQPRAIAPAMFPAPAKPIFIGARVGMELALVEEALFDQAGAFLGRDLDVARREHEGLVGDLLHAALEGVGEARREVDQALGELGIGGLEIQDYRRPLLEGVGDLLSVVEVARGHEMNPDIGAAVATHRSQRARATHVVVGEDVVDLVAASAPLALRVRGGCCRRPRGGGPAPRRSC